LNIDKNAPSLDIIAKTRYLHFSDALRPYIKTWGNNPWYFELATDEVDKDNGYYLFRDEVTPQPIKQKSPAFQGQIH
jgi:hypothetical protein